MSIYYLNFASEPFYFNQEVAVQSARTQGVTDIFSHNEDSLRKVFPNFSEKYPHISDLSRGYGYWLWKPCLIDHYLSILPEGSILMYADVGVVFAAPVESVTRLLGSGLNQIFFNMPKHLNGAWCKRDVFVALNADTPSCRFAPQIKAQWHFWVVGDDSRKKCAQWLDCCSQAALLTDQPSTEANYPEFVEHRHDQSILSILVHKWGSEIFRDPTQEGEPYLDLFPNSPYPTLAAAVGNLSTNEAFSKV